MDFTAIIRKGKKQFVALCPEVDVVSQGYTIEEAIKNLKEAVEVYVEEMGDYTFEKSWMIKCCPNFIVVSNKSVSMS